jgi:hypothetical protein
MSEKKPEGLFYSVQRRAKSSLPAGASDDEILNEFLKFNLNGIPAGDDGFAEAADHGGQMCGTINWLASDLKFEANFFVARKPTLLFFVCLPDGSDPWANNPGFHEFVKPFTVDLTQEPIKFEARPELDKALADMQAKIHNVPDAERPRLLAALGGRLGTNLKKALDELEKKQPIGLRDLFDERLAAFESQVAAESEAKKESQK